MKLQNTHDVGIYCRLSRDDNNGNLESMSIGNQKQMLMDYVKEKGWNLRDSYIDDGYSGTNFDRPDFKRLLRDISSRKIDCVITKDLSRLGRNYAKVGYYTEEFFIEQGVRFIAVNDSFDTMRDEENEIAPFKNVLNEWYPRDISKKVRQVKKSSARQGKFMGSQAPYGYKKSPENKHVLIIDEPAADIMRQIFQEYTQHYIQENTLKTFVLNDIRIHAKLANAERKRIADQLVATLNHSHEKETRGLELQKREADNRLAVISSNIKSLYDDKCLGKLPESIFKILLSSYILEQTDLEDKLQTIQQQLNNRECSELEIERWLQLIGQYMEIKDLDRPTVMELIESITISEASKATGKRTQEITIQYRFIGNLLANTKEDIA